MYRCGDTLVCRTVCTDVGIHLYVGQCGQVWGNTCMLDSVYRCEGNTKSCM